MCQDALVEDLIPSRPRWYDLPAMLLLHRPMRCRMCNDRYYVYRKLSRRGATGDRQRAASFGIFPRLWMHYAFFTLIIGGIGIAMYPQKIVQAQRRLAKLFQQQETVSAESPEDAVE